MFNTRRLFRDVPCPLRDDCRSPICFFSHNPAAVLAVTQVDPLPAPVTTPTTTVVPAKRRVPSDARPDLQQTPSSSRLSYPVDVERPTKLQRTGPAAKPVAVPTASSSSVSSTEPLPHPGFLTFLLNILDRCSYPHDQCWAVKDTCFDAPGMSFTSCLSVYNVVSACPFQSTYPQPFAVSLSLRFHAHILAPLLTHPYQVHVEIIIRSFCRPLRCPSSSKSLTSVRSCASPRARNMRPHDKTNLSKCDTFSSCSSSRQSHFIRPLSPLSPLSRNAIRQRRLLTPLLAQTGTLQLDAKSRMLWRVCDSPDPNWSHYS